MQSTVCLILVLLCCCVLVFVGSAAGSLFALEQWSSCVERRLVGIAYRLRFLACTANILIVKSAQRVPKAAVYSVCSVCASAHMCVCARMGECVCIYK